MELLEISPLPPTEQQGYTVLNYSKATDEQIIEGCERAFKTDATWFADGVEKARAIKADKLVGYGTNTDVSLFLRAAFDLNGMQASRFSLSAKSRFYLSSKNLAIRPQYRFLFNAVVVFAKDEEDRAKAKERFSKAVFNNDALVVVDATDVPFSSCDYEKFIESVAKENLSKIISSNAKSLFIGPARELVDRWVIRAVSDKTTVYYNGERTECDGVKEVRDVLDTAVAKRYPSTMDGEFEKEFRNRFYSLETKENSAFRAGATLKPEGFFSANFLQKVFGEELFLINFGLDWKEGTTKLAGIKRRLDETIESWFDGDGVVRAKDVTDYLCNVEGFLPNNFYSMITGFLMRDYISTEYRLCDVNGVSLTTNAEEFGEKFKCAFRLLKDPNNRPWNSFLYRWEDKFKRFVKFASEHLGVPVYNQTEKAVLRYLEAFEDWRTPLVAFRSLLSREASDAMNDLHSAIVNRWYDAPQKHIRAFVEKLTPSVEAEIKEVVRKENADDALYKAICDINKDDFIERFGFGERESLIAAFRNAAPKASYWLWVWTDLYNAINPSETGRRYYAYSVWRNDDFSSPKYNFWQMPPVVGNHYAGEYNAKAKAALEDAFFQWREKERQEVLDGKKMYPGPFVFDGWIFDEHGKRRVGDDAKTKTNETTK